VLRLSRKTQWDEGGKKEQRERERERKRERERQRERDTHTHRHTHRDFRELYVIVQMQSKVHRLGWNSGNPEKGYSPSPKAVSNSKVLSFLGELVCSMAFN
jgi:hypothetical protein